MDLLANVLLAHYSTLLGTIRHIPVSPSVLEFNVKQEEDGKKNGYKYKLH